ncbi:MAG: matrixin family metalloprotease [Myxococcales bacterium]|nr:matrixin family metalloprotease [Myxococcales bacterium]
MMRGRGVWIRGLVCFALWSVALACGGVATLPADSPPASPSAAVETGDLPPLVDASGTYLQTNFEFEDGARGFMHVTEADMPWVVAVSRPAEPPTDGSSSEAREAAMEAMRMWEAAIRPHVPWFRLEFVEKDSAAPVQVVWKRRIPGPWAGFGGMRVTHRDGVSRVGGELRISTTPGRFTRLDVEEVRFLVAHEFGHVLGLGHCLECDSAMNYAWHTRDRVLVTDTDVRTFLALLAQPVGSRGP